jgi:periplasmic protein TonB
MRGVFEFTGFAGLALALHVVALQSLPQGSESAGSGGDALVTVSAVNGALSDLVAAWEQPPAIGDLLPAALPQPSAEPAPDLALQRSDSGQAPMSQPVERLAPVLPAPDLLPAPQTRQSPPPPAPLASAPVQTTPPTLPQAAPRTTLQTRPQARPDSRAARADAAATAQTRPSPQPVPRAATTAAGTGAASARGTSGPAESASLTKAARQSLMAEWGGKIRNRIDRAKPRGTGRGAVTVLLTVSPAGALQSLGIAASSGQASLDQRALQAVRSAGPLPAAPAGLTEASYSFRLPIRFD